MLDWNIKKHTFLIVCLYEKYLFGLRTFVTVFQSISCNLLEKGRKKREMISERKQILSTLQPAMHPRTALSVSEWSPQTSCGTQRVSAAFQYKKYIQ